MTDSIKLLVSRARGLISDPSRAPAEISALHSLDLLVPRQLWWAHSQLTVRVVRQGDWCGRTRWWGTISLTPLAEVLERGVTGALTDYLSQMPALITRYPESYYTSREIWRQLAVPLPIRVHYLGTEQGLGALESLDELTEDGTGLRELWLEATLTEGCLDILGAGVPVAERRVAGVPAGVVWYDPDLPGDAPDAPPVRHLSLHQTLRQALLSLTPGGTLVWRCSLIETEELLPYWKVLREHSDTTTFHRPQALHPWDPTVYLVASGWQGGPGWSSALGMLDSLLLEQSRRLQSTETLMTVTPTPAGDDSSPTLPGLLAILGAWLDGVEESSQLLGKTIRESWGPPLGGYLRQLGILTIGQLASRPALGPATYPLHCVRGIPGSVVYPPPSTARTAHMTALREAARSLALHKRIMDGWPSGLRGAGREGGRQQSLVSWEDVIRLSERDMTLLCRDLRQHSRAVSNAWLKFTEMLHTDPRLAVSLEGEVWHLCEAPGAWISASARWMEERGQPYSRWRAQTLQAPQALGDHYQMMSDYPDRWDYGDITDPQTLQGYSDRRADLITADGGIPLHPHRVNYGELESLPLLYGQTWTICQCLRQGGSAVLKIWLPCAVPATLGIIRLWTGVFESVHLVKPVSSRPGNSEIYLVGHGYTGTPAWVLEALLQSLPSPDPLVPVVSVSDAYWMTGLVSAVRSAVNNQRAWLTACYSVYYLGRGAVQVPGRAGIWRELTGYR